MNKDIKKWLDKCKEKKHKWKDVKNKLKEEGYKEYIKEAKIYYKSKKLTKIITAGFFILITAILIGYLYYPQVNTYVNYLSNKDVAGITMAVTSNTSFNFPNTIAEDTSVGDTAWNNEANAKADDGSAADSEALGPGGSAVYDYSAVLVTSGSPDASSDDKATFNDLGGSYGTETYGGAADKWGLSLTESDVEAAGFGVAIAYKVDGYGESYFLMCTNFSFDIPDGATIDGVEVVIEAQNPSASAEVDYVKMKVYHNGTVGGGGDSTPPSVSIAYPTATTYSSNITHLNYSASDETSLDSCWWTDDGGTNNNSVTCGQNVTGQNWGEGSTTLTVYANDSSNNLGSDSVTFTVSYPAEEKHYFEHLDGGTITKDLAIMNDGTLNMTNGSDWWLCSVNNSGDFICS